VTAPQRSSDGGSDDANSDDTDRAAKGGLLLVQIDVRPEDEAELGRWYEEEHIPERLAVPGILSATRYRSIEHPGRYLGVYETADPRLPISDEYLSHAMTPWTRRMAERWLQMDRSLWERL
jgi:hypothetical protein